MIEHLYGSQSADGSELVVLYIYCDYRNQDEQTASNLTGAMLVQIIGYLKTDDALVKDLQKLHVRRRP